MKCGLPQNCIKTWCGMTKTCEPTCLDHSVYYAFCKKPSFYSYLIMIKRVIYLTWDFHGLIKEIRFVQRLSIVQSIVVNFGVEYHQLLIAVGSIDKILQLVVTVTKKRQRRTRLDTNTKYDMTMYNILTYDKRMTGG